MPAMDGLGRTDPPVHFLPRFQPCTCFPFSVGRPAAENGAVRLRASGHGEVWRSLVLLFICRGYGSGFNKAELGGKGILLGVRRGVDGWYWGHIKGIYLGRF